jgi:hypothetical protein
VPNLIRAERGWVYDSMFVQPKSGWEYFTAELVIENKVNEMRVFNPAALELIMADDTRLDTSPSWRQPSLPMGNILPRGKLRGWVTWEIPKKVEPKMIMFDNDYTISLKRN